MSRFYFVVVKCLIPALAAFAPPARPPSGAALRSNSSREGSSTRDLSKPTGLSSAATASVNRQPGAGIGVMNYSAVRHWRVFSFDPRVARPASACSCSAKGSAPDTGRQKVGDPFLRWRTRPWSCPCCEPPFLDRDFDQTPVLLRQGASSA